MLWDLYCWTKIFFKFYLIFVTLQPTYYIEEMVINKWQVLGSKNEHRMNFWSYHLLNDLTFSLKLRKTITRSYFGWWIQHRKLRFTLDRILQDLLWLTLFTFVFAEGQGGIHRSDVVEWYLNHIADQIESEEELIEKKDMFEKVLDRLIYHVSKL